MRRRWVVDAAGLAFLVCLAAASRAFGLSGLGLYRDDAWPLLASRTDLGRAVRIGVTTPGFELLVRAWRGLGASTTWAQSPALVASLLAVAGAYLLARRLGCRPASALVAGGVLALAPMAVLYATRVKPYALDSLSCLLLLALAVWVAERPSGRRWTALTAAAVGAPLLSASVLPVAVTAMWWTGWRSLSRRGEATAATRRVAVAVPCAYVALVAAYAFVVLRDVPPPLHASWADHFVGGLGDAWSVVDGFAAGMFYRHGPTGPLLVAGVFAGAIWARRDLAPLLLGPIVIAFGLAVGHRAPFGGGRIDVYVYPCVALAVAVTLERALRSVPARADVLVAGLTAAAMVAFAATDGRRLADRNPYPGADVAALISAVRGQTGPGDGIVVAPFTRYAFALYDRPQPDVVLSSRYSTGFTVSSPDPTVFVMPAEPYETGYDPAAALPFARSHQRIWYLATDTPPSDTPPEVQANEYEPERRLLDDGFAVERRVDVAGAHADLLVRRPSSGAPRPAPPTAFSLPGCARPLGSLSRCPGTT